MHRDETTFHQSYVLNYRQDPAVKPGQPPRHRFVLQELSGEQLQEQFDTFEQVMNFLLDGLLGEQK